MTLCRTESALGVEVERLEAKIKKLKDRAAKDRQTIADLRVELKTARWHLTLLEEEYTEHEISQGSVDAAIAGLQKESA